MRVIQIHAGIHKTGSTAIQHKLARLVPDLAEHGVALPNFGSRGHWHHALAGFRSDRETCDRAWAKLARRMRKSDADRMILSTEHFVTADPADLKAALARLGPHEAHIHVYVRPHIALYTSLYLQRVKAGVVTGGPIGVAEQYERAPEFDYVTALGRFIDVFGEAAVHVREFDPAQFEAGSLIADFWSFLDLPAGLRARALEGGDPIVNPTPTAEQAVLLIALASRLRKTMGRPADPKPLRRALRTLMTELGKRLTGPSTRYRLPLDLQRAIKAQMEPARVAFARHLDRPASAAFLDEPLDAPVPLAEIPFAAVQQSLAATADLLRERDGDAWANEVARFAAGLRAEDGSAGMPVLHLPAPRLTQTGVAA